MDPRLLELELTESVFVKISSQAASVLRTLKEMKISVALDDFGAGYSSLSYLRKFPVNISRSTGRSSINSTPPTVDMPPS